MKLNYRKLEVSDIEKYHEIRFKCLREHPNSFGTTYEEEINKDRLKFDEYIIQADEQNFIIGAFLDEECIGICGFIREEGKRRNHRGHLVQIYVEKSYQGKGIGEEMIVRTMQEAFNNMCVEQIMLGVVTENDQANSLYEKIGFEECGIIRDYLKLENGYLDKRMMIIYKAK